MKTPDSQNHMPIDKLKYFINAKILINYGLEKILVFVNPKKIDFNKIDELIFFNKKENLLLQKELQMNQSLMNQKEKQASLIQKYS